VGEIEGMDDIPFVALVDESMSKKMGVCRSGVERRERKDGRDQMCSHTHTQKSVRLSSGVHSSDF
jgi:hypothetical protein